MYCIVQERRYLSNYETVLRFILAIIFAMRTHLSRSSAFVVLSLSVISTCIVEGSLKSRFSDPAPEIATTNNKTFETNSKDATELGDMPAGGLRKLWMYRIIAKRNAVLKEPLNLNKVAEARRRRHAAELAFDIACCELIKRNSSAWGMPVDDSVDVVDEGELQHIDIEKGAAGRGGGGRAAASAAAAAAKFKIN
jgi:hypothetical protein